jgi:hypothetical protein
MEFGTIHMRTGRWKTWILIGMALVLLISAATLIPSMKEMRREYDFDPGDAGHDKSVAGELRLPVAALSIFRSLAVDYLWIRMQSLQEEGHHFDSLHQSRLICALAPNLPSVWVYHSWNMAYNISVAMENPPERWNWVMAGISLIRDEGLKHNPRSPELYHYLAWIFQHKMGELSDSAHRYYKRRLALEMMKILSADQEAMNTDLLWLTRAPEQWSEVIGDPNVAVLVNKIKEVEPDKFPDDKSLQSGLLDFYLDPTEFSPDFHQLVADYRSRYTWGKLDGYLRRHELDSKWKMDPGTMLELNQLFGPYDYEHEGRRLSLDWRQPHAHAIYWAWQGLPHTNIKDDFDYMRIRQNIYHSTEKLYQIGNLTIFSRQRPEEATQRQPGQEIVDKIARDELRIFNSQDMRMFEPAYQTTLWVIQSYIDLGEEAPKNIQDSMANMLWSGIANFYLAGDEGRAMFYFLDLRKRFPRNRDYFMEETVEDSLFAFVQRNVQADLDEIGPKDAANQIDSLLRQSYGWMTQDDSEKAYATEMRARQIHAYYQVERAEAGSDRVVMPEFAVMRAESLLNFLNDPRISREAKNDLMAWMSVKNPDVYKQVMNKLQGNPSDGSQGK